MDDMDTPKKSVVSILRVLLLFALLIGAFAAYLRYFSDQRVGGQQVYDNLAVFDTRLQNLENSTLLHEKRLRDLEETAQKLASIPPTTPAPAAATANPQTVPDAAAPLPTPASDERIAVLEKEIAALKIGAPIKDDETVYQSIRLLSAFHRLSEKIVSGKPFAAELSAFQDLARPEESDGSPVTTLAPYAESGIPTFATLLVTFDQSVEALNTANAIPPANGDFMQRLKYNLTHLITVRRIDDAQTGTTSDAIVGRAQAHLEREEIEAAVAELKSLPEMARGNFAAWLDDAQMVTEAPSLVDQMEEQVMQKAFHAQPPVKMPDISPTAVEPPSSATAPQTPSKP